MKHLTQSLLAGFVTATLSSPLIAADFPAVSDPIELVTDVNGSTPDTEGMRIVSIDVAELVNLEEGWNEAMVVWAVDANGSSVYDDVDVSIYGQRFSLEDGLPIGKTFVIAEPVSHIIEPSYETRVVTAQRHQQPVVAANPVRGEYAVAWVGAYSADSTRFGHEVFGRVLRPLGTTTLPLSIRLLSQFSSDDNTDVAKTAEDKMTVPALAFNPALNEYLLAFSWSPSIGQIPTKPYTIRLRDVTLAPVEGVEPELVFTGPSELTHTRGGALGLKRNEENGEWLFTFQYLTQTRNSSAYRTLAEDGGFLVGGAHSELSSPQPAQAAYDPAQSDFLVYSNNGSALVYRPSLDSRMFLLSTLGISATDTRHARRSEKTGLFGIFQRLRDAADPAIEYRLFDSENTERHTDNTPAPVHTIRDAFGGDNLSFRFGGPDRDMAVASAPDGLRDFVLIVGPGDSASPSTGNRLRLIEVNTQWADLGVNGENPGSSVTAGSTLDWRFDVNNPSIANLDARENVAYGARLIFSLEAADASINAVQGCAFDVVEQTCTIGDVIRADESLSLVVTVSTTEAASGSIDGSVMVESDSHDPDTSNNTLPFTIHVTANADIELGGSLPNSAAVSEAFTMTLNITNNGPGDAENVAVLLPLPAGVTFVEANGCAAGFDNGVLECRVGSVNNGEAKNVSVRLKAGSANKELVLTASVTSDARDSEPGNDDYVESIAITKSDSKDPDDPGSPDDPNDPDSPAGGGGGSLGWLSVLALGLLARQRCLLH